MPAGEWTFRVRLSDVSVKNVSGSADRPGNSMPYYRCDFDGKIMQSELCEAAGDPAWAHKVTFDYRLDEDDLQSAVSSMASRFAAFEVFYTDMSRHTSIGTASVDLFTLATGASKLQLHLRDQKSADGGANAAAVLEATLMMEHLSVIETAIDSLSIANLPEPMQVQLKYTILEDQAVTPAESRIAAASRDPLFERCRPVQTRTSLRVFLHSTLRVSFVDASRSGALMGAVDVPFSELLQSAADQTSVFKRNLYADPSYRRSFTAHVTGTVAMRNLPCFAQLATGANVDGSVHGKPLLEGLMRPSKYSKFPTRLPDYQPGAARPAFSPLPGPKPDPVSSLPPSNIPMTEARLGSGRPAGANAPLSTSIASAHHPSYIQPPSASSHHQHHYPEQLPRTPTGPTRANEPLDDRTLSPSRHNRPRSPAQAVMHSHAARSPRPPSPPEIGHFNHHQQQGHGGSGASTTQAYRPVTHAYSSFDDSRYSAIGAAGSGAAAAAQQRRAAEPRSPIATAATALKQQHDEALGLIEEQRRRVLMLADDLRTRTVAEQESERRRGDALNGEDKTLHSRFEASTRRIEELRRMQDESEAEASNEARENHAERAAAEAELEELARTETQLRDLLASLEAHADENHRLREVARQQAVEAKQILDNDLHALADFEARTSTRHNRFRTASPPRHYGATHGADQGAGDTHRSPLRSVSGNVGLDHESYTAPQASSVHHHHHHQAAPTTSSTLPSAGELADAITTSNDANFHRALAANPSLLSIDHTWLARACNAPAPNDAIVSTILRQRPELLHMVEPGTANTPLHSACNAQRPNAGVVSLLLRNGANPNAFNAAGLTPMHLAVLNVNDYDHSVKRALITHGGPSLMNQPATTNETPLHLAATNDRHLAALRFLIDNGANTNAIAYVTRDGRPVQATPRDRAVWSGRDAEGCRRALEGATR
jgi:ankyrin repeat protein